MHIRQKRRILGILFLSIFLFLGYYLFIPEVINLEYNSDYDFECIGNKSSSILKHVCFKDPHIFFVETSGSLSLNSRQGCAIESTAHHNPSTQVYVLMTASVPLDYDHKLMKKLKSLQNVHLLKIDIDVLVHDSPIFKWYRRGMWRKSKWKASHLSDALRFFLIWKYGGTYLDMDIVTFRSLDHLTNAAVTENWQRVAAGILLNFDKKHEIMRRCMFDFAEKYDPYNFVNNGPGIFTYNIEKFCDINVMSKISGTGCNINILPPEAAFPIVYDKWEDYFIENSAKNITDVFSSSYMIHVWNKFSNVYKLKVGSKSLYELGIKQQCPLMYEYVQEVGYI